MDKQKRNSIQSSSNIGKYTSSNSGEGNFHRLWDDLFLETGRRMAVLKTEYQNQISSMKDENAQLTNEVRVLRERLHQLGLETRNIKQSLAHHEHISSDQSRRMILLTEENKSLKHRVERFDSGKSLTNADVNIGDLKDPQIVGSNGNSDDGDSKPPSPTALSALSRISIAESDSEASINDRDLLVQAVKAVRKANGENDSSKTATTTTSPSSSSTNTKKPEKTKKTEKMGEFFKRFGKRSSSTQKKRNSDPLLEVNFKQQNEDISRKNSLPTFRTFETPTARSHIHSIPIRSNSFSVYRDLPITSPSITPRSPNRKPRPHSFYDMTTSTTRTVFSNEISSPPHGPRPRSISSVDQVKRPYMMDLAYH